MTYRTVLNFVRNNIRWMPGWMLDELWSLVDRECRRRENA